MGTMKKYFLTNRQARQFMLLKHGLLGEHKFIGKNGAMNFILQAGCTQFDPVDICGKNAEIILHSRVKGFRKQMLEELLYKDRLLVDYPDKQLSIIPTENWPYFERFREKARQNDGLRQLEKEVLDYISENGAVSSADLLILGKLRWNSAFNWSGNWNGEINAARAVLEQLYSTGELVIHHKKGTRKFYDLASRHVSPKYLSAPEPLLDEFEHLKWRVLRRIGAVGLLWNNQSAAFLNIDIKNERAKVFQTLTESGEITPVQVEGIKRVLYCLSSDIPILEDVLSTQKKPMPRMELIAPLDCFLWDRKLTKEIFGFTYKWEIHTPENKRTYGAYTLPLLYGENFAGRVDISCEKKTNTLQVKNIWFEVKNTKKLQLELVKCFKRFAKFNDCGDISVSRNI